MHFLIPVLVPSNDSKWSSFLDDQDWFGFALLMLFHLNWILYAYLRGFKHFTHQYQMDFFSTSSYVQFM